ncbi:MAG: DUF805 domain-containing protein [bacterium]
MDGQAMSFSQVLFSFKGRIGRSTYWLRGVLPITVFELAMWLGVAIFQPLALQKGSDEIGLISALILIVLGAAVTWAGLAIGVKRCHDRGRSAWFLLVSLIPIIGSIWVLIELGFLRGTEGGNRYGPDPL